MRSHPIILTLFAAAVSVPVFAQNEHRSGCPDTACVLNQLSSPSADARPMMRWWWFGIAVDRAEIRRELEQMKADGIGGVEIAFVYPQVVDNPLHLSDLFCWPRNYASNQVYVQLHEPPVALALKVPSSASYHPMEYH